MSNDDESRTIYCGNLSEKVTDSILYELFLQGGPVQRISIPKDKDGRTRGFAFVTYVHSISVPYALQLFKDEKLFNRAINLRARDADAGQQTLVPLNTSNTAQVLPSPWVSNDRLRTGFNNGNYSNMLPNPVGRMPELQPLNLLDPIYLLQLGSQLKMGIDKNNFNGNCNDVSLVKLANQVHSNKRSNDSTHSNNLKHSSRSSSRSHHQNSQYSRNTSPRQRDSGHSRNRYDRRHSPPYDRMQNRKR